MRARVGMGGAAGPLVSSQASAFPQTWVWKPHSRPAPLQGPTATGFPPRRLGTRKARPETLHDGRLGAVSGPPGASPALSPPGASPAGTERQRWPWLRASAAFPDVRI